MAYAPSAKVSRRKAAISKASPNTSAQPLIKGCMPANCRDLAALAAEKNPAWATAKATAAALTVMAVAAAVRVAAEAAVLELVR
jgi:hypothetical protein